MGALVYDWCLAVEDVKALLPSCLSVTKTSAVVKDEHVQQFIFDGAALVNEVLTRACVPLDKGRVHENTLRQIEAMIRAYVNWQVLVKLQAPVTLTDQAEGLWDRLYQRKEFANDTWASEPSCDPSPVKGGESCICDAFDFINGCGF